MVNLTDGKKLKNTWYKRADFWQGMEVMNKDEDVVVLF